MAPLIRLPEDRIAIEWWLARRVIEGLRDGGDGEMPYAFDGVLAAFPERRAEMARWTFGLEFEFAAADAGWVASELHARGLCASPVPAAYHTERTEGYWSVEHDRTVTSVFGGEAGVEDIVVGGEVVSPPLRDTPETWRQVATVLEVLRACGAKVNQNCGLHVHFGADALRPADGNGTSFLAALSRLAMMTSVCFEDLVFRMASVEGGRHRGQAFFYRHCRPLERPLRSGYSSVEELAGALGKEGAARRAALNLTNVGDPLKDTVEFRQCNGTLDGRVVQAFCRLCAALVGAARWSPQAALALAEPLGAHWEERGAGDGYDSEPLWRFLEAACPGGLPVEIAASLLWLFRRGAWQPSLAVLARN